MSFNFSPSIVRDGLVLYLDAANPRSYPGSGTTWTDISRGGNNGTLVNGPTYSSANGGSIVFDGTNDYFTTNTQFAIPTNNRTFDVWVKFNTSGSSTGFFPLLQQAPVYNTSLSRELTGLQKISGGTTIIQPVGNGVTSEAYSGGFNFIPYIGNWINIIGTVEGGVASKMYLNTSLVSNVGISINPEQVTRHVVIGFQTSPNFSISVAKVYNRVLTTSEILQNYNALKSRYGLT